MRSPHLAACTTVLALFLASPTSADTPLGGFGLRPLLYPGQNATATLSNGQIVSFDGQTILHSSEEGGVIRVLGTLPAFAFPSFIRISPDEEEVLFGESSNGFLYTLELGTTSEPEPVVDLDFNYDAVYEDDERVIVSAAAMGFGQGNQLYRVHVPTGVTTQLASLEGASGPVMIDGRGNLYYGTVSNTFPAPSGSSAVLRWSRGQIAGTPIPPLTEDDATLVQGGLDGASSLAYDPLADSILLAETNFGLGTNRIRRITGGAPEVLLDGEPGHSISNLEFTPSQGRAAFLPYQPEEGALLRYNTTDFSTVWERNAIHALRPEADVTGPGTSGPGFFTVSVEDGPASGFGMIWYGPSNNQPSPELLIHLRVPTFWALDLATMKRIPSLVPLDASGRGARTFHNPGGYEGLFATQFLLFDVSFQLVGSSTDAQL